VGDPIATTLDAGVEPGSASGPAAEAVPSIEIGVARERARQALFGARHVDHVVGRFTLLEPVGRGGMGTVYAAYDAQLDRRIAIKLLTPGRASRDASTARRRMLAEARAMAKVSHPNVVTVYEVGLHERAGEDDADVFVAMEFVEGHTLRAWAERQTPDWRRIVSTYDAAGRGLAAVHAAGLVHRDFKPDNVMLGDDGRVRVMDFGLAREDARLDSTGTEPSPTAAIAEPLTQTGALVGTPAYMAPEQFEGQPADARSDQYSFCVALYEALWGKRPHVAKTPMELASKVLARPEVTLPTEGDVPRHVRRAVARGLMRSPEARWPSMTDLLDALTPHRRWRRAATLATVAAGAAAIAWAAAASEPPRPCEGAPAAFAEIWGPGRADALQASFAATALPFAAHASARVTRRLDDYADGWISQHRDACEATRVRGEQSEQRLDQRMRCLDRRRAEADALVDVLVTADARAVERADDAVSTLVDPSRCGDDAFLEATHEPPADPTVADHVEQLRDRMTEAQAVYATGDNAAALQQLEAVLTEAEEIGYAPLRAEALVDTARVAVATREDFAPELARLERGYFAAREARLPLLAAKAALEVSSMRASANMEIAEARHWLRLATVEAHAHELPDLGTLLLTVEATIAEADGDYATAISLVERNLAATEARCGADCDELIELHSSLATLYDNREQFAQSLPHGIEALRLAEQLYGPDHPNVAEPLLRLGETQRSLGHFKDAVAAMERGLALRERQLGPTQMNVVVPRAVLGSALIDAGRVDEGLAALHRAHRDVEQLERSEQKAAVLNRLADAYSETGRLDESRTAYTEAYEIMKALHPDGHPALSILLSNLAFVDDERGDKEGALAGYRESLALRRATVPDPDPQQARFLWNIGKTLMELHRPDEAVDPLREASELLQDQPPTTMGVSIVLSLATALAPTDRAGASKAVAGIEARCHAAEAEQRSAADCDRIPQWRVDHGL
jgi:tetratricopeptide (TPR) repeat protein